MAQGYYYDRDFFENLLVTRDQRKMLNNAVKQANFSIKWIFNSRSWRYSLECFDIHFPSGLVKHLEMIRTSCVGMKDGRCSSVWLLESEIGNVERWVKHKESCGQRNPNSLGSKLRQMAAAAPAQPESREIEFPGLGVALGPAPVPSAPPAQIEFPGLVIATPATLPSQKDNVAKVTDNAAECPICAKNQINLMLMHEDLCGHLICGECYKKLPKKICPFCNLHILSTHKAFI